MIAIAIAIRYGPLFWASADRPQDESESIERAAGNAPMRIDRSCTKHGMMGQSLANH
jgi:hypothetical protein